MAATNEITINIGDLNDSCEIQRLIQKTDEYGFSTNEWETIVKPRCKVEFDDRMNKIRTGDDGLDTIIVKIFTMRYIPNITRRDRIFYDDRIFDIYAIHSDQKKKFMKMWCRDLECKS